MSNRITLDAVEVHAEGEPGRILDVRGRPRSGRHDGRTAGVLPGAASTWLRLLMLHEPRGYPGLCAVLHPAAGQPRIATSAWSCWSRAASRRCPAATRICAVTASVGNRVGCPYGRNRPRRRSSSTPRSAPFVPSPHLDAGKVRSRHSGQRARRSSSSSTFPSTCLNSGTVPVDVVFGGQFFVQADGRRSAGWTWTRTRAENWSAPGRCSNWRRWSRFESAHPVNPAVAGVNLVMLHSGERVPGVQARNTVVLNQRALLRDDPSTWTGALDRSPCGTGTCARMAALHARGQLALGEDFCHQQHHRQRVHRPVDRPRRTIGTCRRTAHPHRPGLDHRPLPAGCSTRPTRSPPATPWATSGPRNCVTTNPRRPTTSPTRPISTPGGQDHEPLHQRKAVVQQLHRSHHGRDRPVQRRRSSRRSASPVATRSSRPCRPPPRPTTPGPEPPRENAPQCWPASRASWRAAPRSSPSWKAGRRVSRSGSPVNSTSPAPSTTSTSSPVLHATWRARPPPSTPPTTPPRSGGNRSVSSGRSRRGTIRCRWPHGRSCPRSPPATRSCSNPPRLRR